MTRALAFELAPHKIRMNGIAAGYIYSEMTNDYLASEEGRKAVKRVPQKRVGEPSDLDGMHSELTVQKAAIVPQFQVLTEGDRFYGHCGLRA